MARGNLTGPRYGSRCYRALMALFECGSMGAAEWLEMCGGKGSLSTFSRDVIDMLLRQHLIAKHDGDYRILPAGRCHLGYAPPEESLGAPTPGRYVGPRQPLSAKHRPALRVMRPGAFDYREIPSVYAGKPVGYRSSITVQQKDVTE
jgi:hypothetical protein